MPPVSRIEPGRLVVLPPLTQSFAPDRLAVAHGAAVHRAPRMRDAIELFPRLTLAALEDPVVEGDELEEIWHEACAAVDDRVPHAWNRIPELLRLRPDHRSSAS